MRATVNCTGGTAPTLNAQKTGLGFQLLVLLTAAILKAVATTGGSSSSWSGSTMSRSNGLQVNGEVKTVSDIGATSYLGEYWSSIPQWLK